MLLHIDSLELNNSIKDNSIDLIFTSPPYFNAREYSTFKTYDEYLNFMSNIFINLEKVLKEGKFFIINTSPVITPRENRNSNSTRHPIPFDLHYLIQKAGFEFIDDIIWEKPERSCFNRISNFNKFRKPLTYKPIPVTEYLFVYRKKTDKLIDWNLKQIKKEIMIKSLVKDNFFRTNIWKIFPETKKKKIHSAPFPLKLAKEVIKLYSFENEIILDPFAGSGTTAEACIELNRNYILIEKDNDYFNYLDKNFN